MSCRENLWWILSPFARVAFCDLIGHLKFCRSGLSFDFELIYSPCLSFIILNNIQKFFHFLHHFRLFYSWKNYWLFNSSSKRIRNKLDVQKGSPSAGHKQHIFYRRYEKCLDLLYKIQENLDHLHKNQVVGKHEYFNSKTGSSHTSLDKVHFYTKGWIADRQFTNTFEMLEELLVAYFAFSFWSVLAKMVFLKGYLYHLKVSYLTDHNTSSKWIDFF